MTKHYRPLPEWLKDKQLSSEALAELREVKQPTAFLGKLPDSKVPDYLYPLVMAARMLGGFAVYNDEASDKARALRIIEQARRELGHAKRRCQE